MNSMSLLVLKPPSLDFTLIQLPRWEAESSLFQLLSAGHGLRMRAHRYGKHKREPLRPAVGSVRYLHTIQCKADRRDPFSWRSPLTEWTYEGF